MIHVISASNRHLYQDIVESHFRLRHDIFVGERRWKALARPDAREVDAYDNEDTVYLLAIEGKRLVGGLRLNPTVKPYLLGEVFPHLAEVRGVPSDPAIWEWTRYFIVKERREGKLSFELFAAVQEFCLEEGIREICGSMETWWLPQLQELGMPVYPLGLPDLIDGAWTMAAKSAVSAETLDHIRALGNITGSVLVRQGPQQPVIQRALMAAHRKTARAS